MVWIEGGEFRMGSDTHYSEEAPAHRVRVDGFFIDPYPVTNRQFTAHEGTILTVVTSALRADPRRTPLQAPTSAKLPKNPRCHHREGVVTYCAFVTFPAALLKSGMTSARRSRLAFPRA